MNEVDSVPAITAKPLTNWKNPPTVLALKQDLTDAKPIHDAQRTKITEWLSNLRVQGSAKVNTPEGNSKIVPKLIRKQAEWRYAALTEPFLSTEDLFKVNPNTWADTKAAEQNQLVLNNQFNTQLDKQLFIDEYVRAAVDEGTVIVRVGWEFEEEQYKGTFPQVQYVVDPTFAKTLQQVDQMFQQDPNQFYQKVPEELQQAYELSKQKGQSIRPQVIGQVTETRTRTVKNRPTVEVCDYRNVIVDPTCQGDLNKATFVIYSFETSLSKLRKDKKYKNLEFINIETNTILGTPDHASTTGTQTFNFNDKPRKKFVVYEYWGYWDIHGDGTVVPVVIAWVGNTIIRMEENPYPDKKIPFVAAQFLPVRKSIYGEPDGALIDDNQRIVGAVTRGMIDIMAKSANGQMGVRKDALDITNRRKFDKGQVYDFNVNVDPRQAIYMHTFPEIPQSAQFMLQLQNMEAESLTGVKSFSQGISGKALGDVAAGVRGALDAASKRELGILRRMAKGIIEIGRKIVAMNAEFLSDKETVRITDEQFVEVYRDDLPGNFDLKMAISTAEEDDNKAQELAFMLQTMGNNMDPAMSRMVLVDIAKLRKMPELAKKIEQYQPQPDPMMQQKQQLELQLLQAQIEEIKANTQKQAASAELHATKVGTEQVKQQHMKSDTDLKNLDFVEQESGTKQERALELQDRQAQNNVQAQMVAHAADHHAMEKKHENDLVKEYIKHKSK